MLSGGVVSCTGDREAVQELDTARGYLGFDSFPPDLIDASAFALKNATVGGMLCQPSSRNRLSRSQRPRQGRGTTPVRPEPVENEGGSARLHEQTNRQEVSRAGRTSVEVIKRWGERSQSTRRDYFEGAFDRVREAVSPGKHIGIKDRRSVSNALGDRAIMPGQGSTVTWRHRATCWTPRSRHLVCSIHLTSPRLVNALPATMSLVVDSLLLVVISDATSSMSTW